MVAAPSSRESPPSPQSRASRESRPSRRKEKGARSTVFLWIVVLGLWLAFSGHFSFSHPLLLGFGVASATLVTYLCRRMGLVDIEMMPLHLTGRTLLYVPWLARQVLASAFEVLRIGLFAQSELHPQVATVEAGQKTSLGLVSYANSITLTPGTLSIETNAVAGTITVHAVSESTLASVKNREMERRMHWVESA